MSEHNANLMNHCFDTSNNDKKPSRRVITFEELENESTPEAREALKTIRENAIRHRVFAFVKEGKTP